MKAGKERIQYLIYKLYKDFKPYYGEIDYASLIAYSKELVKLFSSLASPTKTKAIFESNISINDIKIASHFIDVINDELNSTITNAINSNFLFSGYSSLDKLTGGLEKGELIIIAARPGMGKSAFILNLIKNITMEQQKPSLLFTYELRATNYLFRLISMLAEIPLIHIKMGKLSKTEKTEFKSALKKIKNSKIFIDEIPENSIFEIIDKTRLMVSREKVQFVLIDNLLLIPGIRGKWISRDVEISFIMRKLKRLAMELNVPIIVTTNLNRAVECRTGSKRPVLSDLRESGSIEQDADKVLFIYRAEYYKIDQDWDGSSTAGKAEILIAKNRNGPTGEVTLKFDRSILKYSDIQSQDKT